MSSIMPHDEGIVQESCDTTPTHTPFTAADLSEIAGQLGVISECIALIDDLRINAIRRGVAASHINRLSEIAATFRQTVASIISPLQSSPSSEVTA